MLLQPDLKENNNNNNYNDDDHKKAIVCSVSRAHILTVMSVGVL